MAKALDHAFTEMIRERIKKAREAMDVEQAVASINETFTDPNATRADKIAAAKIVLAKFIPDLKAIEHSAGEGLKLAVKLVSK